MPAKKSKSKPETVTNKKASGGRSASPCSSSLEYPCTECGGDAYVGMSNWSGPNGKIIGKNERLCIRCSKKRGLDSPFTSQKDARQFLG